MLFKQPELVPKGGSLLMGLTVSIFLLSDNNNKNTLMSGEEVLEGEGETCVRIPAVPSTVRWQALQKRASKTNHNACKQVNVRSPIVRVSILCGTFCRWIGLRHFGL